jgi:hypothetical protein
VDRLVERQLAARVDRSQSLGHLLDADAEVVGDLGQGGGAVELGGEGVAGLDDPQGQLLEGPGNVDPPGGVAQAAPQLASDAGDGVGDEGVRPVWLVAVDGRHQADPGRLDQVLVGHPVPVPEAAGQAVGQAQVGQDDPLADGPVAGGVVVEEPRFDRVRGHRVIRADAADSGRIDHGEEPGSRRAGSNPSGL